MKKVGILIVVIAFVVGLKLYNRGSDEKQVLADMKQLIVKLDVSPEDSAYLTTILEREHSRAFDGAYSSGGRRRSSSFDEDKYLNTIFASWLQGCRSDAKTELADKVSRLQQAMASTGS